MKRPVSPTFRLVKTSGNYNMELRERGSAASWGTPKMAPKADREWQKQLDAMEKRIMENIEKLDKKVTESSQELFGKMMENITKSNNKMMDDIKALVVS